MNKRKQNKLNNLLIESVKNGDKEKVIDLLNQGAYIHADNDGRENAVLYLAARYGHKEMVELLLDRGADVHARDDMALSWAATNGHKEVVELLLDHGADVHAQNDKSLYLAASNGHTEVVELLLDRGADIHAGNDAALREAAAYGQKEVVELLEQHIANEKAQEQGNEAEPRDKPREFLNTETVLDKLSSCSTMNPIYPSHAYFRAGENQIDAHSETIEAAYELFTPALSVYENGHLLFSKKSVCVGNYHFEPYTVGKFTSLPDTMNYLKEKYADVEGWEAVDEPVPHVSEDYPHVWKNQSYAEREAMENGHTEVVDLPNQHIAKEKAQAQGNEAEPREYHEHISEKYVAYMKAREQEKTQEQAKVQAQKKSKGKTCEVGED